MDDWSVKGLEPAMTIITYFPAVFAIIGLSSIDPVLQMDRFFHGVASCILLFYGYMTAPGLVNGEREYLKFIMIVRLSLGVVAFFCGILAGTNGAMGLMFVYFSWAIFGIPEAYLMFMYTKALGGQGGQQVPAQRSLEMQPPVQSQGLERQPPMQSQGAAFGLDTGPYQQQQQQQQQYQGGFAMQQGGFAMQQPLQGGFAMQQPLQGVMTMEVVSGGAVMAGPPVMAMSAAPAPIINGPVPRFAAGGFSGSGNTDFGV